MQQNDWKHHAGVEWSPLGPREVPYQQQKIFQTPANRLQYAQYNELWNVGAAPEPVYRRPMYAAPASGYYRRYSLEAASPDSIIYYNNSKRSATAAFIGHPLDNVHDDDVYDDDDGVETSTTPTVASSANSLHYPHALHIGADVALPPDNVRGAFYFKQKRTQQARADANIINTEQVVHNLTLFGRFLEVVQSWPLPHVSFTTACILVLLATFISPRLWAEIVIFPAFRLSFGTLYPAYASYKAVRTKNVKEYVKWMMYWIVYAFFTCIETFTDIFLSWFPFYYEVKVIIVLWLLSPATKGSSTLYRKFVHPMLTRREQEIDEYLNQAKERGYSAVLQLGTKGVNYATNVIMQTALKGGGNLVQTIRRSYSLSDLSEPDVHRTQDEIDDVVQMRTQQRMLRPRTQTGGIARSASGTRHSTGMYFSEVDVVKGADGFNYNIRSSEDISSGYSSAEPVSASLSRTSSMTNASKTRLKARRTEMLHEPKQFEPSESNLYAHCAESSTPEFVYLENDEESSVSEKQLENPTAFDAQQCIQILEHVCTGNTTVDDNGEDDVVRIKIEPHSKMQTIEEGSTATASVLEENDINIESDIELTEQLRHNANKRQQSDMKESLLVHETTAEINQVLLADEFSCKDNNSICSNTDTYHTLESSDEDNESDWYSDALPSLAEEEEQEEETKELCNLKAAKVKEILGGNENKITATPAANTLLSTEIVATASADIQTTAEPKVSAKQLQETLKQIKDNFRATIAPTIITTATTSNNKLLSSRPLTHNKGKAPAPPLPPRPARPSVTSVSSGALPNNILDTGSISSGSPSPTPHRSIFKNFKNNLFRFTSNSSLSEKPNEVGVQKSSMQTKSAYETEL